MNEKLLWFLLGMLVLFLIKNLFMAISVIIQTKEHYEEVHHCNHCRCSFLYGEQKRYDYCPYCGRKLTYHYYDERLELDEVKQDYIEYLSQEVDTDKELDDVEIGLERVNNIDDELEDGDIALIMKIIEKK